MDAMMTGRNLPPRYRMITPDPKVDRVGDGSLDASETARDNGAAAHALGGEPPAWGLIGLFLLAAAIGGAGAAMLGLVPDMLS